MLWVHVHVHMQLTACERVNLHGYFSQSVELFIEKRGGGNFLLRPRLQMTSSAQDGSIILDNYSSSLEGGIIIVFIYVSKFSLVDLMTTF